jgi:hypothetical protein
MQLSYLSHFPHGYATIGSKATNFVPKIWKAMLTGVQMNAKHFSEKFNLLSKADIDLIDVVDPKLHTIRHDAEDEILAGCDLESILNDYEPNPVQFLPTIKCISTQIIKIFYHRLEGHRTGFVAIDGTVRKYDTVKLLAKNDGFDSLEDFFAYFKEDYDGKIIHWTDLRY